MKYLVTVLLLVVSPATGADVKPRQTCSGADVGPAAQYYLFGMKGPRDFCMTRMFYANTYGEARECAQSQCLICVVEDITKSFDMAGGKGISYCPNRR
jgi:hypothetical protein